MTSDYETSRINLQQLVDWYATRVGNRNEATTRLQMIDRIFFECLGWQKDDVILEEAHRQEFADYVFLAPRRILIVEAKKEGDYFELPTGKEKLEYSLQALMRDYPNVKDALEQAAGYCQSRGVPFGAISNGHQIIAFIATRNDGLPPFEGKAGCASNVTLWSDFMVKFYTLWSRFDFISKLLKVGSISNSKMDWITQQRL